MLFCSVFNKVLVQYGERRKVLVLGDTFQSVVKKEFGIDSEETIVLQRFREEWGEYLDIEEVNFLSVKDKTKLRVVLNILPILYITKT